MLTAHTVRGSLASVLALALVQCSSAPGTAPTGEVGRVMPGLPSVPSVAVPLTEIVPPLVNEAGFVAVPPQRYGAHYSARMFYAFHPADEDAASKPLFVFFNGGPGYATSGGLMAYGTGPMTLVDGSPSGTPPQKNPGSFSRFANLLYVDERITGFSYALRSESGATPDFGCQQSDIGDASDFARVILAFLDSHLALRAAPVVLVGESYGGVRATSLLHLLFHYTEAAVTIADDLRASIREHFQLLFPGSRGPFSSAEVAKQFGAFVLIQPLVAGDMQYQAQQSLIPKDPYLGPRYQNRHYDPYDLSKPAGWSTALDARAALALGDARASAALVGVDLATVTELLPPARRDAVRAPVGQDSGDPPADGVANAALTARLGELDAADHYFATEAPGCQDDGSSMFNTWMGNWFLDDLRYARLFLTNARWDSVIYTPAIPHLLETANIPTRVDTGPRAGFARPGWIRTSLPKIDSEPAQEIEIRFPAYENAGHMVAVSQGRDLADDVEQWLGTR